MKKGFSGYCLQASISIFHQRYR